MKQLGTPRKTKRLFKSVTHLKNDFLQTQRTPGAELCSPETSPEDSEKDAWSYASHAPQHRPGDSQRERRRGGIGRGGVLSILTTNAAYGSLTHLSGLVRQDRPLAAKVGGTTPSHQGVFINIVAENACERERVGRPVAVRTQTMCIKIPLRSQL